MLVDTATIRSCAEHIVGVRIGASERSLQTGVQAGGATCHHKAKLWCMPRRIAGVLHLIDRIVEK